MLNVMSGPSMSRIPARVDADWLDEDEDDDD